MLGAASNRSLYRTELPRSSRLRHHVTGGNPDKTLALYGQLVEYDSASSNARSYVALLKACGKCKDLNRGLEMHDRVDASGLLKSDIFIANALIDMYAKCGSLERAQQFFDTLLVRDVVSWTSLISGYSEHDQGEAAIGFYKRMRVEATPPNSVTILCVLKACVSIGAVNEGKAIHAEVEGSILYGRDISVWNTLIDMYIKCRLFSEARVLFDSLSVHNVVSWTTLISGYIDICLAEEAVKCFQQMQTEGILPDPFTFSCCLKACASVGDATKGKEIHAALGENALGRDAFLCNALIDMYAKNGYFAIVYELFYKVKVHMVVSWTSLMSGYVEHGFGDQALKCFEQMKLEGVLPNSATFSCLLQACGQMGDIHTLRRIHSQAIWMDILDEGIAAVNTLLGTYIKCKSLAEAQAVFERTCFRDVVLWTTLVAGYIEYGDGKRALETLEHMRCDGISADVVTFVFNLKACGCLGDGDMVGKLHSEMVEKGFDQEDIGVSTLVDMYAKCGLLLEAHEIFEKLPFRGIASWNALVGGYTEHGDGEKALEYYDLMGVLGFPSDSYTIIPILKACSELGYIDKGREAHTEVMKKGFLENSGVGNTLVDFYGRCGLVYIAQKIFDEIRLKDVVSWNALIAAYAEYGHAEEAVACLWKMKRCGTTPNAITYTSVLKACVGMGLTETAEGIHHEIEREGLLERDLFIGNSLVDMFAKSGLLAKAKQAFDRLPASGVVAWTALIAGYSEHGRGEEALKCFEEMQLDGVCPNSVTFICSLRACASLRAVEQGQAIHSQLTRKGLLHKNPAIGNSLIDMYAKCACLGEAYRVFEKLRARSVASWTALIAACVECGHDGEALECFAEMRRDGVSPGASTFIHCLRACGSTGIGSKGLEMHAEIERMGLQERLLAALVDTYAKCGMLEMARQVFGKLSERDVVSWNALIAGYAEHGDGGEEALKCMARMWREDVSPSAATIVCGLKACRSSGDVGTGQALHAVVIESDRFMEGDLIGNSLIEMYASCGALADAEKVFDGLPARDIVSWTTLIAAYAEHENGAAALECFSQLQTEGILPDLVTFVCALKACGDVGAKEKGLETLSAMERRGFPRHDSPICNSAVAMCARCGLVLEARSLFEGLAARDAVAWNAFMTGFVELGDAETVFRCFGAMVEQGAGPDGVSFLLLLGACGRAGRFDECRRYLESMSRSHGIDPGLEHDTGAIDLLCRMGRLDAAVEMIARAPSRPSPAMWRAVLSMCARCGNAEIGAAAFDRAIGLRPS